METLRVGDPLDKSIDMGAIVDPLQLQRINEIVEKGKAEGGTLLQAGCELPKAGNWFAPSIFTDVEPSSTVMEVEIFGPVAALMTFRTPE
jgi:aldehyde dehydrogenase (NAD+)